MDTNMPFGGFGGGGFFTMIPAFTMIIFGIIIFIIIFRLVTGAKQWSYNNKQPILTVISKVITKRADVRRHHHGGTNGHHHHTSSTKYYVTFEVESGDRIELLVPNQEYGMLAEGDIGKLKFQGTRYLGFERKK